MRVAPFRLLLVNEIGRVGRFLQGVASVGAASVQVLVDALFDDGLDEVFVGVLAVVGQELAERLTGDEAVLLQPDRVS